MRMCYDADMRTTLTIDDQLAKILRKKAYESGRPFKEVVNRVLRDGLEFEQAIANAKPYKLKPVSLGGVLPGINLDKALRLAAELEDMEIAAKLRLRK
jgi:hypothetical protein